MLRVNGLFSWVSYNDRRSAYLFAGFLLAFQLSAMVSLFIPLAMFDPDHAPVYGWLGYALRYGPVVTLAGLLTFWLQMWWHVNSVRKQSGFRYTYRGEEPRLCSIAEPLVIAAGLPEPRLAVIDSPALNAFACGVGRKGAVLVVTRGLLNGLNDDELAAVLAHELVHIRNGDMRLVAAANVCYRTMAMLATRQVGILQRCREAGALVASLFFMPAIFVLILIIGCLRQIAQRLGLLTRRQIASSREFIADAEAVRLTQNPAALISALRRIDGRSTIADLPVEQDAMMIVGASTGAMATHPTIGRRIEALVQVTGTMALAPLVSKDTRGAFSPVAHRPAARATFGRKVQTPALTAAAPAKPSKATVQPARNLLGLTRGMSVVVLLALAGFAHLHREALAEPARLAELFDPRELTSLLRGSGMGAKCLMQSRQWLSAGVGEPQGCGVEEIQAEYVGVSGKAAPAKPASAMLLPGFNELFEANDGQLSRFSPPAKIVNRMIEGRCFVNSPYKVGDMGLYSIDEPEDRTGRSLTFTDYLQQADSAAPAALAAAAGAARDDELRYYVDRRKTLIEVAHRAYSRAGLQRMQQAYASKPHQAVIALLKARMADGKFYQPLSQVARAEYQLLVQTPDDFVTCASRLDPPVPEASARKSATGPR